MIKNKDSRKPVSEKPKARPMRGPGSESSGNNIIVRGQAGKRYKFARPQDREVLAKGGFPALALSQAARPETPSLSKKEIKQRFGIDAPLGGDFLPHKTHSGNVLKHAGTVEVWSQGSYNRIMKKMVKVGFDEQGNPLPSPAAKPNGKLVEPPQRGAGKRKATGNKSSTNVEPDGKERKGSFFDAYLKARGIDPAFARDRGVHAATPAEMHRDKYSPALDAIVFTNTDPVTGRRLTSPARLKEPQGDKKFIIPTGSRADPYRVDCGRPWKEIEDDVTVPIVGSEGPTRALAGAQYGIVVIAGQGVDGFFEPDTKRGKLRDVFYRIKWKKGRRRRPFYLSYDADAATKPGVKDASNKAAELLDALGALVYIVPADRVTKDGKSGIDDEFAKVGHKSYLARCEAAPPWAATEHTGVEPRMMRGDEIEDKEIEYLLDKRIPLAMMTGLRGNQGDGKSFMCSRLAADGSKGIDTFSKKRIPPFSTVYWTLEAPPETVKRKFSHAGGDAKKLHVLLGGQDEEQKRVSLTFADIPVLTAAVKKGKAKLLVIDPIQSFLGPIDMHRANDTRPLLDGLGTMARDMDIAIIITRHITKADNGRAVVRGLGSVDITAAMRTEYILGSAADNPNESALVHSKPGELPRADSLRFEIKEKDKKVQLLFTGISQLTATDITAPESKRHKTKQARAVEFLWQRLEKGRCSLATLLEECEGVYDKQTLERAAREMLVVQRGPKNKGAEARTWELPNREWTKVDEEKPKPLRPAPHGRRACKK
jgi:hypothetical protein